ncbi:hypothetical protein EYF80_045867 [Liparis tanakae]|uniref:Uncharacterized protein n=1 Tax=Liparis tanakae TaxID=230148 RepID=A0A4Z2FT62_9TELE|nr:hypothetical protein EYF80_045867 [Liparis tanakae]
MSAPISLHPDQREEEEEEERGTAIYDDGFQQRAQSLAERPGEGNTQTLTASPSMENITHSKTQKQSTLKH